MDNQVEKTNVRNQSVQDWLVLKAQGVTYITNIGSYQIGRELAWKEIFEKMMLLPIDDWPSVAVHSQLGRTKEEALSLSPNGSCWTAAELLFCMDRYGLKVPTKHFVDRDFMHYQTFVLGDNLSEGLRPASVYRMSVELPKADTSAYGPGSWQLLDESGAVLRTGDRVEQILPDLEACRERPYRVAYRVAGVEQPWLENTAAEWQFILQFQKSQPTQAQDWLRDLVEQQALDAFLATHYGAYRAFEMVERLPNQVRTELQPLVESAEWERGSRGFDPDLEGFKTAMERCGSVDVDHQLTLMHRYGIPGELEFLHALGDPANRAVVTPDFIQKHRAEIVAAQRTDLPQEQAIHATVDELHGVAVGRPLLMFTPVFESTVLEDPSLWLPLTDFDKGDWKTIKMLMPEVVLQDYRVQLEALAIGLYSEQELGNRLLPKLEGVTAFRSSYLGLSMEERLMRSYRAWGDALVVVDPLSIHSVPEGARSALQMEQLLQRDWSHLREMPATLLDRTPWTEEMVIAGLRRQAPQCSTPQRLEQLLESLPLRFRTSGVVEAMTEWRERFGLSCPDKGLKENRSNGLKR